MAALFIDSENQVREMLERIVEVTIDCSLSSKPFLFLDLEGVNLSRHGSVAIMQLFVPRAGTIYIIDVHVLKDVAFNTPTTNGTTLKSILESDLWAKVFFDVRNDSDALFSHFAIRLSSVVDIQLLEFATRRGVSRYVNGLSRCIANDLPMSFGERREWMEQKDGGRAWFAPELGGRYEVFLERPLPEALLKYCAQDVAVMPRLLMLYGSKVREYARIGKSIHEEAAKRVDLSQGVSYNGKGRHMAVGPTLAQQSVGTLPFPINVVYSDDLGRMCSS